MHNKVCDYMSMEEKNSKIENYIYRLANDVNRDYPGLISSDRGDQAIRMYKDSPKDLQEIIKEIEDIKEKLIAQRKEQVKKIEELKKQIKEVPKEDPYFGEVYKSYIIHIMSIYETIENSSLNNEEKPKEFDKQLKQYLATKKVEMNKLLMQQISNAERVKYGQSELFLGSDSLDYEVVSNLYKTFVNDINIVSNDSEGKMYCTIPNYQQLFDANGNLNPNIQYNFDLLKETYDFASKHGKQVKFHTFLWHNAVPENLRIEVDRVSEHSKKREMVLSFLNDYASKLSAFMVTNKYDLRQLEGLNEIANDEMPLDDIKGKEGDPLRLSWWREVLGNQYYLDTLKILKRNFPNTEIIYNEYNEFLPYKTDRIVKIMETIKAEEERCRDKFPNGFCDGLGLQGHLTDLHYDKKSERLIDITQDCIVESAVKLQNTCQSPIKEKKLYITESDCQNMKHDGSNVEIEKSYIEIFSKIANGYIVWGNSDALTWSRMFDPRTGSNMNGI